MDLTETKNILSAAFKSIFDFKSLRIKFMEAIKLPYAKTYILLAVIFTFIFGIVTFPYDVILIKKLKGLEKNYFKSVSVGETNFSLLDVIAMNNIYLVLQSGSEITIRTADINLSLLKLLLAKTVAGTFQFDGLKYNMGNTQIDLNLNGDASIDYKTFDDLPQSGKFNILISNSMIKIGEFNLPESMGGLPLAFPVIKIKSGSLEGSISSQIITISTMKIFGDLNCAVTGTIATSKAFLNSRIELKIAADVNSDALKDYRDFLSKYKNDRNQIVLAISGSLANPSINFIQADSSTGMPQGNGNPPIKKSPQFNPNIPSY
jgi:hypothetical protein